jgi:hypothetical protein
MLPVVRHFLGAKAKKGESAASKSRRTDDMGRFESLTGCIEHLPTSPSHDFGSLKKAEIRGINLLSGFPKLALK